MFVFNESGELPRKKDAMYRYGLIGNCQTAALVSEQGSIDWLCLPRPDSEPIFGRILDANGGHFSIHGSGAFKAEQQYFPNTVVLKTFITNSDGTSFSITDFCPRFYSNGNLFRPMALYRIVEPIQGSPEICVRCNPVNGWSKQPIRANVATNEVRYEYAQDNLRLMTNMPLTYLSNESSFALKEPLYFTLSWNLEIQGDIAVITRQALQNTISYWNLWVKHCSIPTLYQQETIRSALTLKLHCYEDTGAILAALTSSLPEEISSNRNWDYRFCWLRDAYFVLTAFHNLGHFEEVEGFLKFLLTIAEKQDKLSPVYRLDRTLPLPEVIHGNWSGFQNSYPVRSNNQAAEHVQNDVYGEMVLTLAPIFFDERFQHLRTPDHEKLLEQLGRLCVRNISIPDAGLWEIRNGWQEHSFSNLMCWAGLERLERIQQKGYLKTIGIDLEKARNAAEAAVRAAVRNGSLRNSPKDESYDSALLLLTMLRFPDEKICKLTVEEIRKGLSLGIEDHNTGFLYRYTRADDFGNPQSAFLICSFWLVQALAKLGKKEDAMRVLRSAQAAANHLGLFAEHFLPKSKLQTGNFPQCYSHVGQILGAFAVSPPWDDIL